MPLISHVTSLSGNGRSGFAHSVTGRATSRAVPVGRPGGAAGNEQASLIAGPWTHFGAYTASGQSGARVLPNATAGVPTWSPARMAACGNG